MKRKEKIWKRDRRECDLSGSARGEVGEGVTIYSCGHSSNHHFSCKVLF
jgi:hypothetical protein